MSRITCHNQDRRQYQAHTLTGMSDGIAWIGAHHHTPPSAVPGMLGGISLTLARGVETAEFLINLGADLDELAARTLCRELRAPAGQPGQPSPQLNRAMYGTCGEWTCWRTGA